MQEGIPFSQVSYHGGGGGDSSANTIGCYRIGDLCLRARYLGRTIASIAIHFLSGPLTLASSVFQVFYYYFWFFYIHNHLGRYLTTSPCCCVLLPGAVL